MPEFVLDASATLAMCFPDESTAWSDALLEQVRNAAAIHVPAHWPIEVANGLWSGIRRKRINENQVQLLWNAFSLLKIHPESPLTAPESAALVQSAFRYGLTVYDAAYLDLAIKRQLPLTTLDVDLRKAAMRAGVTLL
jgi:predicted nucleic acid-binding protein